MVSLTPSKLLWAVLYDRSFRLALGEGTLDLDSADLVLANSIDLGEAEAMAASIHRSVLHGGPCDGNGLLRQLPLSFRQLKVEGVSASDLVWDFLSSHEFKQYRVLPYCGPGLCLPEAFYIWAINLIGSPFDQELLLYEARVATATLLATNYNPVFKVSTCLTRRGSAWIGLQYLMPAKAKVIGNWKLACTGANILVAATSRGLVTGPVSDRVAKWLSCESSTPSDLAPDLVRQLSLLGLT